MNILLIIAWSDVDMKLSVSCLHGNQFIKIFSGLIMMKTRVTTHSTVTVVVFLAMEMMLEIVPSHQMIVTILCA